MPKLRVFLDLDGCAANFTGGVFRRFGIDMPRADWPWDVATVCGFDGVNDPKFWQELSDPKFWAELDPCPDGMALAVRLQTLVAAQKIDLAICSSVGAAGSQAGKQAWMERHLPWITRRVYTVGGKGGVAGPGKLLIDDHDPNLEAWQAAGGRYVRAPRPWNRDKSLTVDGYSFDPEQITARVRSIATQLGECENCGVYGGVEGGF